MKSISNQILVYILISLSVLFVGRFFYGIHIRTQFETKRLKKESVRKCERIARFYEKPLLDNDSKLISEYIAIEALDINILSIQVLDTHNHLRAGILRTKQSIRPISGNTLVVLHQDSIVRPILHQGKSIGKVVYYPNVEPLMQFLAKLKLTLLLELFIFFLSVAIIVFLILKKIVVNPLLSLKKWVSSIDADKSIAKPELFHSAEIDIITDSVSQLTERLIAAHKENISKSSQISDKESLIASVSTNLPEGMIYRLVTNEDGSRKFTYLSDSFQKIYGFSPEEGMEDPFILFGSIMRKDIQSLLDAEAEAKKNLSIFKCEVRMVNSDGTVRVSRFVSIPTPLENGSVSWDGFELDITDFKKIEADLQQSKFLLESIADGLPDSIFAKDLNGNFLFVNAALAKSVGQDPKELFGKNNYSVFLPDEANKTLEKDFEIMRSGKIETFEEQLTTPSGSFVFLTTKGPMKDAHGKIVGLFGIARDITERKKEEEALRVSQEKFVFAFDSSPNAILIQDEETGQYLEANASVKTVFGYSHKVFLRKTPLDLNLYKDMAVREKLLEILKTNDFVQNMEIVGRHKTGTDLYLLLTVVRRYIDNRPFLYVNVQDVTQRKQVELELQKLNLDKDRFISILGHDLRGPVNSIVSLLDIVNENISNMEMDEIKEIVRLVYQSITNTSRLLDDVLLWATAKSGTMEFNPKIINFTMDCHDIIDLLQFTATAKNITIELLSEISLEVYADKNMLDTILRNLISNALKFTNEYGKINVSAQKNREGVVVSVSDNGVGISDKDLKKVFDKTELFTSIGTNEEKGTGFGLKLCQEFVEKHGGKIWVESEVGVGSTFHFSLPNVE